MAAGGCDGGSNWSRAPGKCRQSRWVGSTCGGIFTSLRSGYPWAALYSLSEPPAWPPALRAESEIPPGPSAPPPFLKGGLGATDPQPIQGAGSAQNRPRPVAGWADAPLPGPAAQGAPILPGGQWRPGFGRESSGRPGRHPPLDGCRPARGPGGLPGRSLSLSLGRESEARTSAPTGVS